MSKKITIPAIIAVDSDGKYTIVGHSDYGPNVALLEEWSATDGFNLDGINLVRINIIVNKPELLDKWCDCCNQAIGSDYADRISDIDDSDIDEFEVDLT